MDPTDKKPEETKEQPAERDEQVEHAVVELEQSMGQLRHIVNRLKSAVWKSRLKSDEPLVPVVTGETETGAEPNDIVGETPHEVGAVETTDRAPKGDPPKDL